MLDLKYWSQKNIGTDRKVYEGMDFTEYSEQHPKQCQTTHAAGKQAGLHSVKAMVCLRMALLISCLLGTRLAFSLAPPSAEECTFALPLIIRWALCGLPLTLRSDSKVLLFAVASSCSPSLRNRCCSSSMIVSSSTWKGHRRRFTIEVGVMIQSPLRHANWKV